MFWPVRIYRQDRNIPRQSPVDQEHIERSGSEAAGDRKRILCLVSKAVGIAPNQRYRLEQWAPHLARDHGIDLDFVPFESPRLTEILYEKGRYAEKAAWVSFDFLRRAGTLAQAQRYDGVVVCREASLIGPAIYERLIAWTGKPIIFDFDDAIWSSAQHEGNASAHGLLSRLHFAGKTSSICRLASAVTVGNDYLGAYARKLNDDVAVVPTSIELADYPPQPELPEDGPFVVCWTGSTSTLIHFETARPALEAFASEVPTEVKVICSGPPHRDIAGAKTTFTRWTADNEAAEVGACHVGIMPLPDTEFTRGKCGLKALQFMATERPVVVSPVGMNADLIKHDRNGLIASTTDEFINAFRRLASDPELRRRLGKAGRKTVEDHYSARSAAARFARAVLQALG